METTLESQTNWQVKKYKRTSRINHIKAHEKIIWFDNLCLLHK